VRGQRQLHQDAVDFITPVQIGDQRQQFVGGRAFSRRMLLAVEADFLGTLHFAANVDLRRWVVSHEHHSETGSESGGRKYFHLGGNFCADFAGYFGPVENPGCHRNLAWSCSELKTNSIASEFPAFR
jgi:hypothetical protein